MRWDKLYSIVMLLVSFVLASCQLFEAREEPLLAVPVQVNSAKEIELVQLSYELNRPDLDNDTKIHLYYRRGVLYDSLGLRIFAQSDFNQILAISPRIPAVYNYLGVLSAASGDTDAALLSYNTALELNPKDDYSRLNRAITLYNNKRYKMAREDAMLFYKKAPDDAFRLLWLFLIEYEIDSNKASKKLETRYQRITRAPKWNDNIVAFYLNHINESELMRRTVEKIKNNRELADRLCEMYFYLGKYYLIHRDENRARTLFKYALSSNRHNFLEHQQALYELDLLKLHKSYSAN